MHELYDRLIRLFPLDELDEKRPDLAFVTVPREQLRSLLLHLRDREGFTHLVLLTAVDWIEADMFQLTYLLNDHNRARDLLHGLGQLLDEGDGLIRKARVADRNGRRADAVVGQLVEQDQTWGRFTNNFYKEPLRHALALVIRPYALVKGLTAELIRQFAPQRAQVNAVFDLTALGRVAGLVRKDGDTFHLLWQLPADGFPKSLRVRRPLQPICVLRQVPQGDQRVRLATTESRLETDDPVPALAAAPERARDPGKHRGQSARQIRLAEELLGVEVHLGGRALDDRPEVCREDRLGETSFADVLVRCRDGVPGFECLAHDCAPSSWIAESFAFNAGSSC